MLDLVGGGTVLGHAPGNADPAPLCPLKNSQSLKPAALAIAFTRRVYVGKGFHGRGADGDGGAPGLHGDGQLFRRILPNGNERLLGETPGPT